MVSSADVHLVAQHHLGLRRERAGKVDALLLAAGELVGKAHRELRTQVHHGQQLPNPILLRPAAQPEAHLQRSAENVADPVPRVERGVRHLVDELHPAQLVSGAPAVRPVNGVPVEADLTPDGGKQAGHDPGQRRLPAARLSDDADGVATFDVDIDVSEDRELRPAVQNLPVAGAHVGDLQRRGFAAVIAGIVVGLGRPPARAGPPPSGDACRDAADCRGSPRPDPFSWTSPRYSTTM